MAQTLLIIPSKLIFLLLFLFASSSLLPVSANSDGLVATLNNGNFQIGDKVIINGSVSNIVNHNPVTIIVRDPIGNVYEIGQVDLSQNLFNHDFLINDNSLGGVYTINIKYVAESMELHFTVNASVLTTIQVMDSEIKVRTNGTNLIKYGNVVISPSTKIISISMDTSKLTTNGVEQQYQIPKKIVDTPDGKINFQVDGNRISCVQSETDTVRILDCNIPFGSKEIELSGNAVIPEFGSMAGFTILVSLIVFVFFSKFSKILNSLHV